MKTILLRFFLFLSFCWLGSFACVYGQVGAFYQTYHYGYKEKAFDMAATPDGGYIMSGFAGIGIGTSKIVVIKTDSMGNEEWHRIYGSDWENESWAVVPLPDGGYMVGASSTGSDFLYNIYLLRLNNLGDSIWTKTVVSELRQALYDMEICPDGGFIIAGSTVALNEFTADAYALKLDNLGNKEWEIIKSPGLSDVDVFWEVEVLPDSSFIFGGSSVISGLNTQFYMMRTSAGGEELWSKHYGWQGSEFSQAGGMITDGNEIIMAGSTTSFVGVFHDLLLLKVDMTEGDTIWTKVIDKGEKEFSANTITLAKNGDYLVSAWNSNNSMNSGGDVDLVRLNNQGEIQWVQQILNSNETEKSYALVEDEDGSIVIAGETSDVCAGCAFLIRVTEDGYLSNTSEHNAQGIQTLFVYPNPAKDILNVQLTNNKIARAYKLFLYNSIGQIVFTSSAISPEVSDIIDLRHLPNGAYFLIAQDEYHTPIGRQYFLKTSE